MQVHIKPSTVFSNDTKVIEKHGDLIWETLCDCLPVGIPFTMDNVVRTLRPYFPQWKPRTLSLYTRAVMLNVYNQPVTDFRQIDRLSSHTWIFPTAPDTPIYGA